MSTAAAAGRSWPCSAWWSARSSTSSSCGCPSGESLLHPPSKCPLCETPIAPRDNIPVVSWLLLRGRCRAAASRSRSATRWSRLANAVLWVLAGAPLRRRVGADPVRPVLLGAAGPVGDRPRAVPPPEQDHLPVDPGLAGGRRRSSPWPPTTRATPSAARCIGGLGYAGFLLLTLLAYELIVRKEGMGMGDVKLAVLARALGRLAPPGPGALRA